MESINVCFPMFFSGGLAYCTCYTLKNKQMESINVCFPMFFFLEDWLFALSQIEWSITCLMFYAVSTILQKWNGGHQVRNVIIHMTIKEILWILLFRYIVIKSIFFNCWFFPCIIHVPGVLRVFLLSFFLIWVVVFFLLCWFCFVFFSLVTYQVLVQLIKLIVLEDFDAARHDVIKPSATFGNESVSAQKKK